MKMNVLQTRWLVLGQSVMVVQQNVLNVWQHVEPAAAEGLKKWDGGRTPMGREYREGDCLLPIYRGLCYPRKFFENIGANLCNMVHFM